MIKDVAGLVPGAYKGRGKGECFIVNVCAIYDVPYVTSAAM